MSNPKPVEGALREALLRELESGIRTCGQHSNGQIDMSHLPWICEQAVEAALSAAPAPDHMPETSDECRELLRKAKSSDGGWTALSGKEITKLLSTLDVILSMTRKGVFKLVLASAAKGQAK